MLVADGVPAARTVTVHEGIDLERVAIGAAREPARGALAAASGADRRQRRRARAAQGTAAPDRSGSARRPQGARRAVRHRGRGRAAPGARAADQGAPPREARAARRLPARRAVAAQGVRHLRDELGHRRPRHVAARRDGRRQADRRDRPPAASRRSWSTATPASSLPPRDHAAMADAIVRLLKDAALRAADGRGRAARALASGSAPSGWCRRRYASTSASRCSRMSKIRRQKTGDQKTASNKRCLTAALPPRPHDSLMRPWAVVERRGAAVLRERHAAGDPGRAPLPMSGAGRCPRVWRSARRRPPFLSRRSRTPLACRRVSTRSRRTFVFVSDDDDLTRVLRECRATTPDKSLPRIGASSATATRDLSGDRSGPSRGGAPAPSSARLAGTRRRRRARSRESAPRSAGTSRATRRGWHSPLSGHCESPCFRPKPQAFIMPTWQIEKSNRTGSVGIERPQRRGDVGSHPPAGTDVPRQPQAAAQPDHVRVERHDRVALARRASRRPDRPRRGAPSSGGTGSAACRRCPPTDAERNSTRRDASARGRRRAGCRAPAPASRNCRAPRRHPARRSESPSRKKASIDPDRSSICRKIQSSAAMSIAAGPAVHHRPQLRMTATRDRIALTYSAGPRTHDREQRVDRVEHARDAAERQRRRAEARDLPIARVRERPYAVDGIARRLFAVVVAIERVE